MSTTIQSLYEEIFNQISNLKTNNDEDQLISSNLVQMIRSSRYAVYKVKTDMVFLNEIEFIKQYRKTVTNRENIAFFPFRNFVEFKVRTMAIVYAKNTKPFKC